MTLRSLYAPLLLPSISSRSFPVAQYILVCLPLRLLGTFIRRLFEVLRGIKVGVCGYTPVGCTSVGRGWMCEIGRYDDFGALFGSSPKEVGYLRALR